MLPLPKRSTLGMNLDAPKRHLLLLLSGAIINMIITPVAIKSE
jgi:hypothetical protein